MISIQRLSKRFKHDLTSLVLILFLVLTVNIVKPDQKIMRTANATKININATENVANSINFAEILLLVYVSFDSS